MAAEVLDARYGRTARNRTKRKWTFVAGAAAFVVAFAAWVIFGGLDAARSGIQARDIGFSIIDDHAVDVTFELSAPVGEASYCAVQALSDQFAVVGWKVVEVPAGERFTRRLTERVRTLDTAVTGLIYRCWLA